MEKVKDKRKITPERAMKLLAENGTDQEDYIEHLIAFCMILEPIIEDLLLFKMYTPGGLYFSTEAKVWMPLFQHS